MAISQKRSKRKSTGGLYHTAGSKEKANLGSLPTLTKVGKDKVQKIRVLGGNTKARLLFSETINIADTKTKKVTKETIVSVDDNPANRNYIRRNIITKGAVVILKSGKKAKVTSRPGQSNVLNGVIVN
jgi:small subunit ribosomal protein S8e